MSRRWVQLILLTGVFGIGAQGHVGSPDIYVDAQAGPYMLFIVVRTPTVIPGTAALEIRSETPGIREIRAVPLPMAGDGARFAPVPESLKMSAQDSQFFTGTLWLMVSGSWQVKISADGSQGSGTVSVPVPSVATSTKKMEAGLGAMLSVLMTFLVLRFVAIIGASVREAKLSPGSAPDVASRRRGRVGMIAAFVFVVAVIWFGKNWWNSEAANYSQNVYKPLNMRASLKGTWLTLTLIEPGWFEADAIGRLAETRTIDDLTLDHGHLVHLYLLREPDLDVIYHLHPELKRGGVFDLQLPTIPAGMAGMDMSSSASLPNFVSFPFGLPTVGRYRAFIQMKHGAVIETGVFDMQAY